MIKFWRCIVALVIIGSMLVALLVLDLAAWHWGCESSEPFDSSEWERQRLWRT